MPAKWMIWAALAGSAVLTVLEWIKNHPPMIALIAVIHFAFVLVVIMIVAWVVRLIRR